MTPLDRRIRFRVYQSLAASGRVPRHAELAASEGVSPLAVRAALERLAAGHELVLGPGDPGVVMAHPFSAVETDYVVTVGDRSWFANCAWDGLAILGLFGDGRVDTVSPLDGDAWILAVSAGRVAPKGLVYFPVPARSFWDDIEFT